MMDTVTTAADGRSTDTCDYIICKNENIIGGRQKRYMYNNGGYKNRSRKSITFKEANRFGKAAMLLHGISSSLLFASAFTTTTTTTTGINQTRPSGYRRLITGNPLLIAKESQHNHFQHRMSSIENDPNDNHALQKVQYWLQSKLPPPPEDKLSCAGDIYSIFLYTFLDHAVNGMYDDWLNSPEVLVSKSASAAIETSFAASAELGNSITQTPITGSSFPVWFDLANSAPFGNIPLSSALPIAHHIQYAPALDTTGMASVLLASTWLVCGYFTGAFDFKNTLECTTNKAIVVTAKNWLLTCLIMLAIAYGSDILIGSIDCLHKTNGLTKADEDFVLGSLTVLLAWRFTLNSFLGYGSDDNYGE